MSEIHLDKILADDFTPSTPYVEYILAQKIKQEHPDLQHIIVTDMTFPLSTFLKDKNIEVKLTDKHRVHYYDHVQHKLTSSVKIGLSEFRWSGTDFLAYKVNWPDASTGLSTMYILLFQGYGKTKEQKDKVGEDLINAAYKWSLDLKDEIFVFTEGCWVKDKKLWKSIQIASWDNLVLDKEFVSGLKRDTETFFASREIYETLETPWKRGLLLLGPPGNGKTESIKVLLKESRIPSLYVKSFSTNRGPETGVRSIFEFARQRAPCILVLEDLDSMITPSIRSFFLNEIDGLEKNDGILTIATSNHPERIDDAILNRPSRFDVKYTFQLPSYELRKTYITKWMEKMKGMHGIEFKNEMFVREMAEQTEGFSFAFLKELFLSFLLRTAHDKASGKTDSTPESNMKAQIKQLVAQIKIGESIKEEEAMNNSNSGYHRPIRLHPFGGNFNSSLNVAEW